MFSTAVSKKAVPEYYEVIKKPMDLKKIEKKLKLTPGSEGSYKSAA